MLFGTNTRVAFVAAALTLLAAVPARAQLLNEIRTDQLGVDDNEYIEFSGTSGESMTGLHLVVIGDGVGGSGVLDEVVPLDNLVFDAKGLATIAENAFTAATCETDPAVSKCRTLGFENKDNLTFLIVSGLVAAVGDDVDTDDDGVIDGNPWSSVLDRVALIESDNPPPMNVDWHYGPPTVGPEDVDGSPEAPGHVYRCGQDWLIGPFDFEAGEDSPLLLNTCPTPGDIDAGPIDVDAGPDPLPDAGAAGEPDAGFGVVPSGPLTPRSQPGVICSASGTGAAQWLPLGIAILLAFGMRRRRAS